MCEGGLKTFCLVFDTLLRSNMFDGCLCLLRQKTKIVLCAESKNRFARFIEQRIFDHVTSLKYFISHERR